MDSTSATIRLLQCKGTFPSARLLPTDKDALANKVIQLRLPVSATDAKGTNYVCAAKGTKATNSILLKSGAASYGLRLASHGGNNPSHCDAEARLIAPPRIRTMVLDGGGAAHPHALVVDLVIDRPGACPNRAEQRHTLTVEKHVAGALAASSAVSVSITKAVPETSQLPPSPSHDLNHLDGSPLPRSQLEAAYRCSVYDNLPSLHEARERFAADVSDGDMEQIGALFVEHDMDGNWGLVLQHKHLEIAPDQKLVEQPLDADTDPAIFSISKPSAAPDVAGHVWQLDATGELAPYEFVGGVDPGDATPASAVPPAFAAALGALLHSKGFGELLGLGFSPETDDALGPMLEHTDMAASANIITKNPSPEHLDGATPATWKFAAIPGSEGGHDKIIKVGCACYCDTFRSHTHFGHVAYA